jgi:hypothetical protein
MKLIALFILLFLTTQSFKAASTDSLSILFIGNSYTHMNVMPKIFEKLCKDREKPIYIEMNTRSGASFNVHTTRDDMYEAIRSRKWDYVVLQGFSRELSLGYDKIDKETLPYLNRIVDSVKANNACTNMLFYLTWGYKNGYSEMQENNTYDKMAANIIDGYCYLGTCYDVPIVPVGVVWKNIREKYPDINLYSEDDAHPNKNGSYLAACTFFSAVFRESIEGAVTSTIEAKTATIIQKEASAYVLSNLNQYGLDKNYFEIMEERTPQGKYKVSLKANYSNLAKITWNLGNGIIKHDKELVYYYKKPGKYIVSLTVEEDCGVRNYTKKIKYTAPLKPIKRSKSKPSRKSEVKRKN